MSSAAFGENTQTRNANLRRLRWPLRAPPDGVSIRHLRGATEFRGRRDLLIASGQILAEWLPPERVPGQRTRATLHARHGGRDVFARRLDDDSLCVLIIQTPTERVMQERMAFERFLRRVVGRRE